MINPETAKTLRIVGLVGVGFCISLLAAAPRSSRPKALTTFLGGMAVLSALLYFIGLMAVADSGGRGIIPPFP
jgi:hypothetical protein